MEGGAGGLEAELTRERDERQDGNETVQKCKCGGAACKGAKVKTGVGLITLDQPCLEVGARLRCVLKLRGRMRCHRIPTTRQLGQHVVLSLPRDN
ncbi:MAG: hypothetical protein D4R66_04435 [Opitutales bacterium]|nr:MAG: hypothetical protein D4R66_04435 [Opitutales bacterium]